MASIKFGSTLNMLIRRCRWHRRWWWWWLVGRVNGDAFSNKRRRARGRRPIFMGQPIGAHVLEERVLPSREFFSPPGLARSTRSSIRRTCEKERAYLSWSLIMHRPRRDTGMEEEFLLPERANIRFASIVARIFSPSPLSLSLHQGLEQVETH